MTDRYLPSSELCGNPRRNEPQGADSGGARMADGECTSPSGNPDALPSIAAGRIVLPWPPTANTYWRHPSSGRLAGRHLLSEKGREYREAVKVLAIDQRWPNFSTSRIRVDFECYVPDHRRRDLDNLLKGLCDSLTHAGLWHDDEQIDDLRIRRAPTVGGMVKVRVEAI